MFAMTVNMSPVPAANATAKTSSRRLGRPKGSGAVPRRFISFRAPEDCWALLQKEAAVRGMTQPDGRVAHGTISTLVAQAIRQTYARN